VPQDPFAGILDGLEQFAHPEAIRNARLGTTIATNAVLENRGDSYRAQAGGDPGRRRGRLQPAHGGRREGYACASI
jgi:hypothetical protein